MTETRSIVVEREIDHPPERIWRALTQPHLIAEWLMSNNFSAGVGDRFSLDASWGRVDCEVLTVEPERVLAYRWGDDDLDSVVTWTLEPTRSGTLLRLEQTGFRHDQPRYFHGARSGWPNYLDQLMLLVDRLD